MGFEVKIHIGGGENITLRGADNGVVEFCKTVDMKGTPTLIPFQFFPSLEGAFKKILRLRVCRSDATDLQELRAVILKESKDLQKTFQVVDEDWPRQPRSTIPVKPEIPRSTRTRR